MRLVKRLCLIFLFLVGLPSLSKSRVLAAGGTVLWEELFGLGWFNSPGSVLVNGNQLVFIGSGVRNDDYYLGGYGFDGEIGAYDVSTGGLLWSGSMGLRFPVVDFAVGLAMSSQHYFVVGNFHVLDDDGPDQSFHRKYNPLNGSLEWERAVGSPRADQWRDSTSIAAVQGKFFISGILGPSPGGGRPTGGGPTQAFTRAYKSETGALVWEVQDPPSSGAGASVASGNRLFVVLSKGDSQVVRAYDVATGAKIWQKSPGTGKSVSVIKVSGNQLVVAGTSRTVVGDPQNNQFTYDYFVRSLRADTGAFLWEDNPHKPGDDWASGIAIGGGKIYMCGAQTNAAGNPDFLVKAYDAPTGRALWKSVVDKGGPDVAADIALNSSTGMVFAVGSVETASANPDLQPLQRSLARAYHADSGALAWEDFPNNSTSDLPLSESLSHVVVAGATVVTVGVRTPFPDSRCGGEFPCQDILIRAYDTK